MTNWLYYQISFRACLLIFQFFPIPLCACSLSNFYAIFTCAYNDQNELRNNAKLTCQAAHQKMNNAILFVSVWGRGWCRMTWVALGDVDDEGWYGWRWVIPIQHESTNLICQMYGAKCWAVRFCAELMFSAWMNGLLSKCLAINQFCTA